MVELTLNPADFEYVAEATWTRDVITVDTHRYTLRIGDMTFALDALTVQRFRAAVPTSEPVIRSWQDENIDDWFPRNSTQHVIQNTDEDWFIVVSENGPKRKIKALLEAAYATD